MQIRIDRDSVSAGDDIDSHEELRRYQPQIKIGAVIYYIVASGFLPELSATNSLWRAYANELLLAEIPGDWNQIYLCIDPDTELQQVCHSNQQATLVFKYVSTLEPGSKKPDWTTPGPRKYRLA